MMTKKTMTKDSEKGEPESGAGENPMFADDGVCCENVETPGVDVRQEPLQFLLQEHSVRNNHLRIKPVSKGPVPPARRVTLKSAFVSVIRCRWSK